MSEQFPAYGNPAAFNTLQFAENVDVVTLGAGAAISAELQHVEPMLTDNGLGLIASVQCGNSGLNAWGLLTPEGKIQPDAVVFLQRDDTPVIQGGENDQIKLNFAVLSESGLVIGRDDSPVNKRFKLNTDSLLSRQHAFFAVKDGILSITDLHSTNGTKMIVAKTTK